MCTLVINKYLIQRLNHNAKWVLEKDEDYKPIVWFDLIDAMQEKELLQEENKDVQFRLIRVNDTVEIIE